MAVAAMTDASMQGFLDDMYDYLVSLPLESSDDSYFMDHIQMLTLLLITGNQPNFWYM